MGPGAPGPEDFNGGMVLMGTHDFCKVEFGVRIPVPPPSFVAQ